MKLKRPLLLALLLIGLAPARALLADPATNSCVGITEPVFDVTLSMAVPGIIMLEKHKEGDFVSSNEVIVELDSELESLEVDRRRLVMDNRKADWESTKVVFNKTASVSRDELLKKEADYQVALTEYKTACEQLQRRKLIAPGDGVITAIHLHVGESCSAYQPVAHLVDTRKCYFIGSLEPKAVGALKLDQPVQVQIEDQKNPVTVDAKIVFVSPVVDSASGLQKVKAIFDNADGKVRPGVTGKMLFN